MRSMSPRSSVARCSSVSPNERPQVVVVHDRRRARRRGSGRRSAPRARSRRSATSWRRSSSCDCALRQPRDLGARGAQLGVARGQRAPGGASQAPWRSACGARARLGLGLPERAPRRAAASASARSVAARAVVLGDRGSSRARARRVGRRARRAGARASARALRRCSPPARPRTLSVGQLRDGGVDLRRRAPSLGAQLGRARLGGARRSPRRSRSAARGLVDARARRPRARGRDRRPAPPSCAPARREPAQLARVSAVESFSWPESAISSWRSVAAQPLERLADSAAALSCARRAAPAPPRRRARAAPRPPRARGSRASAPARPRPRDSREPPVTTPLRVDHLAVEGDDRLRRPRLAPELQRAVAGPRPPARRPSR